MALPSFDNVWRDGKRIKPRIQVLEIRDRTRPDQEAIAWMLVEREETYARGQDGTVNEAKIKLSFQRLFSERLYHRDRSDYFLGGYSKRFNTVSLTSDSLSSGGVFVDPPEMRGQRLGTYLMSEIVQWVKQWPDASVNTVELIENQADVENRERRNRFYERYGLVFDYTDPEHQAGRSLPMLASDLKVVESWKHNITEHRFHDYLSDLLREKEQAVSDLQGKKIAIEWLKTERSAAEQHPLRWAVKLLYYRYASSLLAGGIVVLAFALLLSKLGAD